MIQVWIYDKDFNYIDSILVEQCTGNMTDIPLEIGYIKPKFNVIQGTWFEGATPEEVNEWVEQNRLEQNNVTEEEKLKNRLNQQEQAIGILATQLAKNTLLQNGGTR